MSKNAVTLLKGGVPAHIGKFLDEEANIVERGSVPSLGIKGKVWTISLNGQDIKVQRKDEDGDLIPVSVMRVVILDYAKARGRAYYESGYDPNKPQQPTCWSDDGKAPHESVKEPCARTCAECEWSKKGSKVSDNGKAVTACSQYRLLAVVPYPKLDFQPLRLKIPVTSDWDPDTEGQQWQSYQQYTDYLRAHGVKHTASLITKMKFDTDQAYPKILFQPGDWLTDAELAAIRPVIKSPEVASLISGSWTPAGVDGKPTVKEEPAPKAKAKVEEDDDGDIDLGGKDEAPKKATPKAKEPEEEAPKRRGRPPAEKPASRPAKAAPKDDDDDGTIVMGDDEPAPKKTAPAKGKTEKAAADVPDDVASLLGDWDDE